MDTRTKARRPAHVTLCSTCLTEVGVVRDWNNRRTDTPRWRVALHKTAGARCGGSRVEAHPNTVLETR